MCLLRRRNISYPTSNKENTRSMTHPSVHLQMASEDLPSVPNWFGEVAIVAEVFITSGVLKNSEEQVRFARARFGLYGGEDSVAVLIGYAVGAAPTLQELYG